MSIEIRPLTELSDLYAAVDLQTVYWGFDVESLVPAQVMLTIVKSGGHVVGAFDGDKMVGVLIGFMAADGVPAHEHLKIYSKRMVVLPEYRGNSIAQHLKFKQRELALAQGVNYITWTYDPMLSINAYFNIRKLGCVCCTYTVDYYGNAPDNVGLTILGRSDRLVVSWVADAAGVVARVDGTYVPPALNNYFERGAVLVNPTHNAIDVPTEIVNDVEDGVPVLLETYPEFRGLVNARPDVAREWQAHSRSLFVYWMNERGYNVTDFLFTQVDGRDRAFYVLERQGYER